MIATALCSASGITVRFPGVTACDRVEIDLRPGEVHAVVGENGAGKSTLMHVLAGTVRPQAGAVMVGAAPLPLGDPHASRRAGVAMVFQRFRLVPALTVAQNVVLGLGEEPWWLGRRGLASRVQALSDRLELDLDAAALVQDLPEGARQRVEILRLMHRGARVLILDEPTSVLAPQEAGRLMRWVRARAGQGVGVFLVSHKIPEVLSVADRITVMRGGAVVARDVPPARCTVELLAALMVGCRMAHASWPPQPRACGVNSRGEAAPPVLVLQGVSLVPASGRESLRDVDLHVCPGEIVGVAGVSGNGQRLLAHVAAGLLRPQSGRVLMRDRDLTGAPVRAFLEAGVRFAPEERDGMAVARSLPVAVNASLRRYRDPDMGLPLLNPGRIEAVGRDLVESGDVRAPAGVGAPAATLSGGNLQKLIMARETERRPALLVASQPTQGLDVAASARVRHDIVGLARSGTAVLLVSSDLDEVLDLSDRVAVMYKGRLAEAHASRPFDREAVGRLMMGGNS